MKKCKFLCFYLVLFIVLVQTSCDQIGAGAYNFAEFYELRGSEEIVLQAIHKFKDENPEYNLPPNSHLKDGPVHADDYWHHLYFYYPEERKIIKCWIRPDIVDKNQTTFAFVAINFGSGLGSWKEINHHLEEKWNEREKQKFRKEILNKIIANLKDVE